MCATSKKAKPSLIGSVLLNKCPRCRQGNLFTSRNPYNLSITMRMPEKCAVCGQQFELETGFYFGTGYVSYGLAVMLTVAIFVTWTLTIGLSYKDNSIFWCLGINATLLVILQPAIQRLSRSIWIAFFVPYDGHWDTTAPVQPNHGYKHADAA